MAKEYGVLPQGFVRQRLPEIRQEITETLIEMLTKAGIDGVIDTRPDSITGLLIDTFAEREADIQEAIEEAYLSKYPNTASGASLDQSVAYTGVLRLGELSSSVYAVAYGAIGSIVPSGFQARHKTTQRIFASDEDVTIGNGFADVKIKVATVSNAATYTATIDNVGYSYTSDASASVHEIIGGLTAALLATGLNVSSDGAQVHIHAGGRVQFDVSLTSNLAFNECGSSVLFKSIDFGAQTIAASDVSEMVTQTIGITRIENLQAGTAGRSAENDSDLRARYQKGVFRLGAATLPSIEPNLIDLVPEITTLRVFENDSDELDEFDRLPHSIHVVADGGLDINVATAIFKVKGAGIDTNGDIAVDVADGQGVKHSIRFDRPEKLYVWVKATLTLLDEQEQEFPSGGQATVKSNLLAAGAGFRIGDDIVWQKLLGSVYKTSGIANVELKVFASTDFAATPVDADYAANNIVVLPFQASVFDNSRIVVV